MSVEGWLGSEPPPMGHVPSPLVGVAGAGCGSGPLYPTRSSLSGYNALSFSCDSVTPGVRAQASPVTESLSHSLCQPCHRRI